ncbi:MAG: Hsp20/alpha crystallin family protein [Lachnospiraceae bacterium]|jgi:HSP20 family molecular chaperone IbpA|nr:Hsp20/alpha crystallin family protein [Lachnospiraceae bacterium]MCI1327453.1 Hsp20/alpha crystallin family protein [Lachnospiraceae bacterium]
MLFPSIFTNGFFDDDDDEWDRRFFSEPMARASVMKTDVKENDSDYELSIELPGFSKDDIQAQLNDGYLTVTASKKEDNDKKDENGKYIRRERYQGSCSRSFYVGRELTQDDIHAKFEDGVLKISVPKKAESEVEEKKHISIEG